MPCVNESQSVCYPKDCKVQDGPSAYYVRSLQRPFMNPPPIEVRLFTCDAYLDQVKTYKISYHNFL